MIAYSRRTPYGRSKTATRFGPSRNRPFTTLRTAESSTSFVLRTGNRSVSRPCRRAKSLYSFSSYRKTRTSFRIGISDGAFERAEPPAMEPCTYSGRPDAGAVRIKLHHRQFRVTRHFRPLFSGVGTRTECSIVGSELGVAYSIVGLGRVNE